VVEAASAPLGAFFADFIPSPVAAGEPAEGCCALSRTETAASCHLEHDLCCTHALADAKHYLFRLPKQPTSFPSTG
jgi:hypothetical protein